jgi:hypothetical protein
LPLSGVGLTHTRDIRLPICFFPAPVAILRRSNLSLSERKTDYQTVVACRAKVKLAMG